MLHLQTDRQLASIIGISPGRLYRLTEHVHDHVRYYELIDPSNPKRRSRVVMAPSGQLRHVQATLLHRLFRPRLRPTPFSFGGIAGRNAVQNARQHLGSRFAFTTDIENFFPSISYYKVQGTFRGSLGCSPSVATLLAKLCTHDGHLAPGLITSPILADYAVRVVDARIAGMCERLGLVYSRFVDDVTLSGPFRLSAETSGLVALVRRILSESGFEVAEHKEQDGRLQDGDLAVTGLRQLNGHLDVTAEYLKRLERQLDTHAEFGGGGPFEGLLFTRDQLAGRVEYVCQINPHRRRALSQRMAAIDWEGVRTHGERRGLVVCHKVLRRLSDASSDCGIRLLTSGCRGEGS